MIRRKGFLKWIVQDVGDAVISELLASDLKGLFQCLLINEASVF